MAMYHRLQTYRQKTGSFYIHPSDKENLNLKRWISEQKHQHKCFKLGKAHFSSQMKRKLLMDIGLLGNASIHIHHHNGNGNGKNGGGGGSNGMVIVPGSSIHTDPSTASFEFHSFEERIEQLKTYKKQNGDVDIPVDDPLLGQWMETQRRQLILYNKGKESKLDAEKVSQLKSVGVDVINVDKPHIRPRQETSASMQKWNNMFEALNQFQNRNGHCQVAKSDGENQQLYKWVCQQRLEYKKLRNNRGNKMTASRLQKLNDIGFVFTPRAAYLRWEERMEQLKEYKQKHGHLRVPVIDPDIGEFVARQRVEYAKFVEGKPSNMNQERVDDLTNLGFVFQVGKRRISEVKIVRKTWEERFEELLQYKDMYGHTLVPQNNSALGEWVHKQRKMYKLLKSGKPCSLTTERALKLADINFVFDASGYRRGRKTMEEPINVVPMPVVAQGQSQGQGQGQGPSQGQLQAPVPVPVPVPTVPDPYEHIATMPNL